MIFRSLFPVLLLCSLITPVSFAKDAPIEHLVLLKLKAGTSEKIVQQIIEKSRAMKDKIPEIVNITAGKNFSKRNKGYQVGLVIRFKNKKDIKPYLDHPVHVELSKGFIRPYLEDIIVIDYEL